MLRPFFKPKSTAFRGASDNIPLGFNDWELDLSGTEFPGSHLAKAQILNENTHPHLKLSRTMRSIPKVEPGDQVYCESDFITRLAVLLTFVCLQGTVI